MAKLVIKLFEFSSYIFYTIFDSTSIWNSRGEISRIIDLFSPSAAKRSWAFPLSLNVREKTAIPLAVNIDAFPVKLIFDDILTKTSWFHSFFFWSVSCISIIVAQ